MTATTHLQEDRQPWQIAVSVETFAYLAVFLIALGLRWFNLGAAPLSDAEARQAFAAWSLLHPAAAGAGSIDSPLTFGGLALSFALAGTTTAAARFLPMLGGLALAFTPVLFRDYLGRAGTWLAVLLLALSPGAVAASRMVGGASYAMLGLVAALLAFQRHLATQQPGYLMLAGVGLAASLLADFGAPIALLAPLLGGGFMLLTDEEGHFSWPDIRQQLAAIPWRYLWIGLLPALALIGTLFFLAPAGLGALADQLGRFASGLIRRNPGVPYLGITLAVYDIMLLVFGLVGAWLASQSASPWQRFLAGWGIAALLLGLLYPGAGPVHGLWSILPLAMLSAPAILALFEEEDEVPRWGTYLHGLAVIALCGMFFASLTRHLTAPRMVSLPGNPNLNNIPLDLIFTILWLVAIVGLWFGLASLWSTRAAWRGTGLGGLVIGLLISMGQSASLASTRATSAYDIIHPSPAQVELDLLVETAQEVSKLAVGNPRDAGIVVVAPPDGALAWALRDFTDVTYTAQVDASVQSVMVITPVEGTDPALGSAYVGQDFPIVRRWLPEGLPMAELVKWVLYRSAASQPQTDWVILWVREDIYRLVPATGPLR